MRRSLTRPPRRLAKLPFPGIIESKRERAPMAARKNTRPSSAKKKPTRKTTARKSAARKVVGGKATKAKKPRAQKGSAQTEDVVYSDLRKIALARALARR